MVQVHAYCSLEEEAQRGGAGACLLFVRRRSKMESGAGACTLFATHFTRLAELAAVYPNCKLWHFGVSATAQSEQLDYTWKLQPGQQQAVHYGLTLANAVGIPQQACPQVLPLQSEGLLKPSRNMITYVCLASVAWVCL